MRDEHEVWQALLRRKGLSVTDLASRLGVTRQHAHRLLTVRRPAETPRDELEAALALGHLPANARCMRSASFDDDGELDVVSAGDAQPLFGDRELATSVAKELEAASHDVCVLPVWPGYAWRNLVGFHAAGGADPEARKLFVVDRVAGGDLPLDAVLEEIRSGFETTLRARADAHDPVSLQEVESQLSGYTDARLPQ